MFPETRDFSHGVVHKHDLEEEHKDDIEEVVVPQPRKHKEYASEHMKRKRKRKHMSKFQKLTLVMAILMAVVTLIGVLMPVLQPFLETM